MMLFSELYSAYYNAVADVLRAACDHPVTRAELRLIVDRTAFGESVLNIEPALTEGRWQLLLPDGRTPLKNAPSMPLTTLQRRWLKAVLMDRRIRLFGDDIPELPGVEPLFGPDDICVFDRFQDGDPYDNADYQRFFRLILRAIRERTPLRVETVNQRGTSMRRVMMPEYLEYSEKDDKFRLIGSGCRYGAIVNLARITHCQTVQRELPDRDLPKDIQATRTVTLTVTDERNALERVLMHFAHFEKQAERLDDGRYSVVIRYHQKDETEMVIRILGFGPMVQVTGPDRFADLIRDRLIRQRRMMMRENHVS